MDSDRAPTLPPPSPTGPPPRGARHVIAVGGGRGGAGKSVLSANLAVYLAQLGRTVLLCDANPAGGDLHAMLGVSVPPGETEDSASDSLNPLETGIPGLQLLPQAYSRGSTTPVRPGRKPRWARRVRQLDIDYVLMDLGAGTAPATLDLFLTSDLGIVVATPDPPGVEATYRFARAAFVRRIRRTLVKDRFKVRLLERAEAGLPPMPAPLDLVRGIARYDDAVGALAATELAKLRPRLVVNFARHRNDNELGPSMVDVARRYLGVDLDYVGTIEADDSVTLSVVHSRPLLIESPTSKSARNLERIARRVLALATTPHSSAISTPVSLVPVAPHLYETLGTHRGATDEEVRRAYKRQSAIYAPGSLPLTSLLTEEALDRERTRIEEAHDTLLDPLRRRSYDVSTFPEAEEAQKPRDHLRDAALEAEREMLREHLAREITPETQFTGALLRKVRESQGIEIDDIADTTKISGAHLRAIENEDFATLPALVYTRGFVHEIAKFLKLDPAQVTRSYLKRMRSALSGPDHAP